MDRWKLVAIALVLMSTLACPEWAAAQTTRVFNFLWASECLSRGIPLQIRNGHGLATLTYTGAGAQLRYSGPDGDSPSPANIAEPSPGTPGTSVQGVFFPNGCGMTEYPGGQFNWSMSFDDPLSFELTAGFQGGGELLWGSGVGTETIPTASFQSPAEGATVSGTVPVRTTIARVLPGVSLIFRLLVDGREVASQTSTTLAATFNWNAASVSAGAHRLELRVTDKFGATVAIASRGVTVGTSGGSSTLPPPPPPSGSALRVSFTSPGANATVSGPQVVVHTWVDGASAGTNSFSVSVDGNALGAAQSCACTHVWRYWDTTGLPNGTHTITGTVRDGTGKTGTASMTVIVRN